MKWSAKFHDVLMRAAASTSVNKNNNNASNAAAAAIVNSFWHGINTSAHNVSHQVAVTLKLNSLNANTLVGCVFMADGNNLHASALTNKRMTVQGTASRRQLLLKKRQAAENVTAPLSILSKEENFNDNDDLTQITSSSLSEPMMTSQKGETINSLKDKKNGFSIFKLFCLNF